MIITLALLLSACDEGGSGVDPVETSSVIINELMARNVSTITDELGDYDDWVELYNASAAAIDVGGYTVTDDLDDPVKATIAINSPEETTIPAGGYLLLWIDNDPQQGPTHIGFNISGDGEEFGIYNESGDLVDAITFGPQNDDISYGRLPDASDQWVFLLPSPNMVNVDQAPNLPPTIRKTQHSPAIPFEDDIVEVTTEVTDEFGIASVQLHYQVDGGDIVDIDMTDEGFTAYRATIPAAPASSLTEYYITATDTDGEMATDPRFIETHKYNYTVLDVPDFGPLYINELMAANSEVIVDEYDDFDDWIEIYNAGAEAVDLGGMYITDDLDEPTLYQIPFGHSDETTVPAGGFLLLWADKELHEGAHHVNFKLSSNGESVGLYASDLSGNVLLDAVNFPALVSNQAYGRTVDGGATLQTLDHPTPGTSNDQ